MWDRAAFGERRLLVHNLVAHLVPGARVRIDVDETQRSEATEHALSCGLEPAGEVQHNMFRRTHRTTVHDLVAEARKHLVRLTPESVSAQLAHDGECLLVDTRTPTDRLQFGMVPGSIHIPRTTLEWRADPSSGYSHPRIRSFGQHLIVMCDEGYSSSLAAASLQRLGFVNSTDLVGGFRAWRAAGLAVQPANDLEPADDGAEAGRR